MEIRTIKAELDKTLVDNRKETSVFLVGSMSSVGLGRFNRRFSDVDLLIAAPCTTFDDYVAHLRQAIKISATFNVSADDVVDVFMLSRNIMNIHFACLSVLAGARQPQEEDLIVGSYAIEDDSRALPDVHLQKTMYQMRALRLSQEGQRLMPFADASEARRVAKLVRKTLWALVCASTPEDNLRTVEDRLLAQKDYASIAEFLDMGTMRDVFQNILDDSLVEDWPAWMMAQEEIARWLAGIEATLQFAAIDEQRLYEGIDEVLNLLLLDLKNIFLEKKKNDRLCMIGRYSDRVAGLLVKLALAGVVSLKDFTVDATPTIVRRAYEVLLQHMRRSQPGMECLAAAVILLEYALTESILKENH